MQKRVSFHTLGCRLNMSETGQIAQGFEDRGYKILPFGEEVDVTFLNTCTVTDGADSTCRNMIRKSQKYSPEGKVVVAGCYAQMHADQIKKMQGVDLILGTNEKYKVFDYLDEDQDNIVKIDKTNEFWGATTTKAESRTRAFLKIQDGCNYICSFCIIPFARGRSRTISIKDAVDNAKKLIADGYQEIVLTGVNIGEYESSSNERLADLVKRISELNGLKRLRLSSVEPNTITEELLKTLKDGGVYQDHFHIPLQSGCDKTLKSMRRKYDISFYKDVLFKVKTYFPNASIGADIIAGYPEESDEDFLETYNFVKNNPLTHFHIFPYSKRKNTTASKMENQIQAAVKKERVKSLINLGENKLNQFMQENIGKESFVLFESEHDSVYEGYSSNYLKIRVRSNDDLRNTIRKVRINKFLGSYLEASLI